MSATGWHLVAPLTGTRSRIAVALVLLLGLTWLFWPVWGSFTAPTIEDQRVLLPAMLTALGALLVLVGWGLWRDAGRQMAVFAPIVLMVVLTVLLRLLLSPGVFGVEPTFAIPLLAGAALGGPAGFFTGALACLTSSAMLGLIATPLVGQTLVWGLFGLAGGLCVRQGHRLSTALLAIIAALFGPIAGVLLNLTGWASDTAAKTGTFLIGANPKDSVLRLIDYSVATSLPLDATRGVSVAIIVLLVGARILRGLRYAVRDSAYADGRPTPKPDAVAAYDLARRERSDRLQTLWSHQQGERP